MSKITFRIWILVISLALAFLAIFKVSGYLSLIGALLIILIPYVITKINSSVGKFLAFIIMVGSLVALVYFSIPQGVVINNIDQNSSAFEAGIREKMVITEINSMKVISLDDYARVISSIFNNQTSRVTLTTTEGEYIFLANNIPIEVSETSLTRIKTGLDLSGGVRAIVRPVNVSLTSSELADLIDITNQRLNAFGISDVTVREVTDLQGDKFMLIEIAGATNSDLEELIAEQGKFEAKIGNNTVFTGGSQDITSVCRNDATCATINGCSQLGEEHVCNFAFTIYLSEVAAKRHADITRNIALEPTSGGRYLAENLTLILDDSVIDTLLISSGLRGQETTQISIQGSGRGLTNEDALNDAKASMHKLQTLLITGSIPYKLEIVKLDTISPLLGKEFTRSLAILGIIVFALVSLAIFIVYRKPKVTFSVILTMFSEAFITLGIAALINWNLDAPSIAGIIAGMGTGVNDQIVILAESVSKVGGGIRERIKKALFIVFGAFLTIVAAMLPLFWAGAGLLTGFALTTIIGVTVGILITRPAFADMIRRMEQ